MSAQGGDDGWTQVTRKASRGVRHVHHVRGGPEEVRETTEVQPNVNPTLTIDDLRKYHEGIRNEWEATECCNLLKTLVADHTGQHRAIDKAICLGPGSFDPANGSWAARRAAHLQVEAFKTLVGALNGACRRLVVQEPAFTSTDRAFCAELGLEVAEGSGAFAMVDGDALVFGIHLYIRTWNDALRTLPAMFVGTGLESWQEMTSFNPELETLLAPIASMHASYDHYPFPSLGHVFSSTCVYWQSKPDAEDDEPPS